MKMKTNKNTDYQIIFKSIYYIVIACLKTFNIYCIVFFLSLKAPLSDQQSAIEQSNYIFGHWIKSNYSPFFPCHILCYIYTNLIGNDWYISTATLHTHTQHTKKVRNTHTQTHTITVIYVGKKNCSNKFAHNKNRK